jgi:NAD+ synthase
VTVGDDGSVSRPRHKNGVTVGLAISAQPPYSAAMHPTQDLYQAATLALRDYVRKNGFSHVILGLSGGIDSALTAAIAADALGVENVHAYLLPSPYTRAESVEDALKTAENLGVSLTTIPLTPAMTVLEQTLAPVFGNRPKDVTEENIQSRLRGLLLMAISNKTGAMLLTTGNKSEIAVGYATLYGDMCGGYNPLKDMYKCDVVALCHWRNNHIPVGSQNPVTPVIPQRIIRKPPSAELRPDQKDEDSLPPYPILDAVLKGLIEHNKTPEAIIKEGFEAETVLKICTLLRRAEYKRRQSATGVKLTSKSFGRDWRFPVAGK